jgi:hypothetical protein
MHHHFDAEQLAAFADGSLSREERAAAEAHAADCPRCLQLLAAMVRTEERAAIQPPRERLLPALLRWSVPLLAGAAALALWINLRPRTAMEPVVPVPPGASATAPSVAAAPPPLSDENDKKDNSASSFAARGKRESSDRVETRARADQQAARVEAEAPAPQERQRAGQSTTMVTPVPPLPAAPPPAASPVAAPVADASAAKTSQAPAAPAGQAVAENVVVRRNASQLLQVMSPDLSSGWRIVGKTIVHSSDGGKTWAAESVPVRTELIAGASPSSSVAWFVGRAGYILLTTGTNQWRRVTFPEPVDLAAVTALSDREAEVRTSDGRIFATSDGGQTWKPR